MKVAHVILLIIGLVALCGFDGVFTQSGNSTGLSWGAPTGNVLLVDTVYGDNATSSRTNRPFKTIQAAINAAQAGDLVHVFPGTYNEILVCKNSVSVAVFGGQSQRVVIQRASSVTENVVTMAESMVFCGFYFSLAPTAGATYAVVFSGTSNATSSVQDCVIKGVAAGGTVSGVVDYGTGTAADDHVTLQNVRVATTGFANAYIRPTGTPGTSILRGCQFTGLTAVNVGGGTAKLFGCLCNGVSGIMVSAGATASIDPSTVYSTATINATGTLQGYLNTFPRNVASAVLPTANDDKLTGFGPGSRWTYTVTQITYLCVDATVGAAVWKLVL